MAKDKDPYKMESHEFKFRIGGKLYCTHCGLFKLNNEFTDWSIRMGCNYRDHSQYENKRHQLTKLWD